MFGPTLGPRRRSGIALTVAAATMEFALASGAACAGDGPPEAVIGTFETTRDARAAQGRPATFDYKPQPAAADNTADDEVSRAYADAMDALENGKTAIAQRKLELVVARDPDGHLAKSARGYLADLYRDPAPATTPRAPGPAPRAPESARAERPSSPPPGFPTAPSALGARDIARQDPKPAPQKPSVAPAVAPGVAVSAGVEEEFIVAAGDRVFFAPGSAELGQRARIVLAAQARWLSGHREYVAVIEGHADDGDLPDEQSAKLSQARAAAVQDRLIEEGVPADRLSLVAHGRRDPVADCPGAECAAQNRRVVTVLKGQGRDLGLRGRGPALASDRARLPTQ